MTLKDITIMATNEEIIYLQSKIKFEHENLCFKTKYEAITSNKKIKKWVKEIQEILNETK